MAFAMKRPNKFDAWIELLEYSPQFRAAFLGTAEQIMSNICGCACEEFVHERGPINAVAERSADPEPAFLHVSRVLEQYPQFELESLRWSVGRIGELRQAGPKPAAPAAGQSDSAAVLVEVSGRVQATQRNDYRGITAQVQRFASALVGEGYELVRTQLPFDVTSEGVLTGDIGGTTETAEAPRFTVALARRLQ